MRQKKIFLVTKMFRPSHGINSYVNRELRSHDGDAKDSVDKKMNLYFTFESRDTLKSFTLFINVKTIKKLNLGHNDKFETEI